jgi:uncharacterized protein (DUF2141 family)
MVRKISAILVALAASTGMAAAAETTLAINVTNVGGAKGKIVYVIHNQAGTYDDDAPGYINGAQPAAVRTTQIVLHDVKPGDNAVTLFWDENDNGELDKIGFIPAEPVGLSNIDGPLGAKPRWDEIKFEIKEGEVTEITIPLIKYM